MNCILRPQSCFNLICTIAITFFPSITAAQDEDANPEISKLVNLLASRNESPILRGPSFPRVMPESWDEDAQKEVEVAFKRLENKGKEVIPYLIEKLDDNRYSMTRTFSTDVNLTVAQVCKELIEGKIEVLRFKYGSRENPIGRFVKEPDYISEVYAGDYAAWWEEEGDRPLSEIQSAILNWRVAREREIGFKYGSVKRRFDEEFIPRARRKIELQIDKERDGG